MVKKKTDERRPCIYCAKNKITGKYYVGQTRFGLKHRQSQHFDRAFKKFRKTKFCKALRKFGKETFIWKTLYIVRKDNLTPEQLQSLLNMREKAWVKYFNSFINGYNQDEGGTGGVRYKYATLKEVEQARRKCLKNYRNNNREKVTKEIIIRRDKREALNPQLKEQRLEYHQKYMKENQQIRRSKKRDKINTRQQSRRAAKIAKIGHEAYRAQFNERRRKRKEQKLLETNI